MFEPIAIVGRSCVLPGALTPEELWANVVAGRDLISSPPEGYWGLDHGSVLASPSVSASEKACSDRGGYVAGFDDAFDPEGFAIPPEKIKPLDPMVKWLLYCGRAALDNADLGKVRLSNAGVILGNLSYPTRGLSEFAQQIWLSETVAIDVRHAAANRFNSGYPIHLLADALGLGGGAFALDAACASSLYAIKLASDRLQDRVADIMLAGAVNRADDLFLHIGFTALQALSPSGRSRPFDGQADGLLPAEGAAIIVLMRLADAVRDGQRIYGIIRGSGLSNDGNQSSFLAPDVRGEIRAMRAAYARSGLAPEDISYVECHATGTPVGDAIEIESMANVFSAHGGLPVGSLKSNLGHLITVSGVAGLLKVLAAMEAKTLPPTLHAETPIDAFEGTPLHPQRDVAPWLCDGPRVAAINNFGFGGNNAHLLVEEFNETAPLLVHVSKKTKERPSVAICGIGVLAGASRGVEAFANALMDGERTPARTATEAIELPFEGLRFPPNDLSLSLPQQPMIIEAALEAVSQVGQLPADRTGVIVGMGCDPEIARYGLRWRLSEILQHHDIAFDADRLSTATDGLMPVLTAAGVIGSMPNIPANRLNVQFDWQAFGFTVSSEELSGLVALELATRALAAGELDAALVGAVDLSVEPVHMAAADVLFPSDRRRAGDAAVALVLKRLEDARRDGDLVYAILTNKSETAGGGRHLSLDPSTGESPVTRRFGHAHAASGLLHVAAAALSLGLDANDKVKPGPSARRVDRVSVTSFSGHKAAIGLSGGEVTDLTLRKQLEQRRRQTGPGSEDQRRLRLPAHFPPVQLPPLGSARDERAAIVSSQTMPEAPELPPVAFLVPVTPTDPSAFSTAVTVVAGPTSVLAQTAVLHREYIEQQSRLYQEFLALQEQSWQYFTESGSVLPSSPTPKFAPEPDAPQDTASPVGPSLSRADLEKLASGRISDVLGPLFKQQDAYPRQVRMPKPPLLLADRVMGIAGEAGSMGQGTIWTETDVPADAWYLHCGRMPPGIVIESGQADLLLISWLGIDFINKGERVYRLLGCDLTFHEGGLPKPGDTLRYDIHVDGHAKTGDVRLFFFHYNCRIGDRVMMSVRNGQAGFFSDEELLDAGGVLWDAADDEPAPDARRDPTPRCTMRRAFDRDAVSAYVGGYTYGCFGEGFEMAAAHQRTPTIPDGRMRLIDTVPEFDPDGGPWQRGYLRAEADVPVDCWFYDGHFKNDPCMPGTLMADAALQALSFAMAGMGFTIDRDGWRFEPVTGEAFKFICRGQVIPDRAHRLTYEIFIEEVIDGDQPTVYAALLCSSDGFKVFQCRHFGLRLVPDWPLTTRNTLIPNGERPRTVGPDSDVRGDFGALLACAWGAPSAAFGSMYRPYDGARRVPRLPGPPYHCVSRIVEVDCPPGEPTQSGGLVAEYDVLPDAWYFRDNGHAVMPFSVLMEVLLQPCGWLASYMGFALADEDLAFRNLDGDETIPRVAVGPDAGCLTTRTTLSRFSQVGDMTIVFFRVECECGGTPVLSMSTSFGFFDKTALANQVGLTTSEAERTRRDQHSDVFIDLRERPDRLFAGGARVAEGQLRMIDAVTGFWPEGGDAGLGCIRGLQEVDPHAWYFKAHFYQDPVQPGSMGLEAFLQLLQCAMLLNGLDEGVENPRFEAIALDEALIWKYRGQVMPTNTQVTTELELTRVERDGRGVLAAARGSLWVDGLRIYEVENLAMRIVSRAANATEFNVDAIRSDWRRRLRTEYWPVEDIFLALVRRFVGRVVVEDPDASAAIKGQPTLFLSNHQTVIESLLFPIVGGAIGGRPIVTIAKQEHRETWLGRLIQICREYPGVNSPRAIMFFDRDNQASMIDLVAEAEQALEDEGLSLMIYAEGTRTLHCRQPVRRISAVFPDLAVAAGMPIVPVRFAGGLPVPGEDNAARLEFPFGFGRQDIYLGRPIMPETLAAKPLGERRDRILDALNGLGPDLMAENPSPPDVEFAAGVARWTDEWNIAGPRATVLHAIASDPSMGPKLTALVDSIRGDGELPASFHDVDWLKRLSRWFTHNI